MLDGYTAYKIYLALNLHFTSDSYDVFKFEGRIKASFEAYLLRNDMYCFEKAGKIFEDPKHCVQVFVANIAYGNRNFIYNTDQMLYNHKNWVKIKQSITKVFSDDVARIESFSPGDLLTSNIHIESKVILNDLLKFTDSLTPSPVTESRIRLIRKLHRFVKYDVEKVSKVLTFKQDELR